MIEKGSQPPSYEQGPPPPAGYPPQGTSYPAVGTPLQQTSIGQQYQQDLFARCARGEHDRTRQYGMCGIITAIFCFPCGLICLFSDSQEKCARCGVRLD